MTLYLPGFHLQTLRRKPRSALKKLADEKARIKQHSITQLGEYFSHFIPVQELDNHTSGQFSRRRLFSKTNIFWAFFSQVLDADGGCQEAVRKVQAFAATKSLPKPSSSTSAYCQARQKLNRKTLEDILMHTSLPSSSTLSERRVVVADGTGVSMPDTDKNQSEWPQVANQKPGCGFPQARICACFDLRTGLLLSHAIGNKKNHELPLLRQQQDTFKAGDIFLGDKGFCSFYDVCKFQQRGVDSVITLARRTPVSEGAAVKVLGPDDILMQWPRPSWNKALSYSKEEWSRLPKHLTLRQIKVSVETPGFRVKSFYLITTLLDPAEYSANALSDLYRQRWDVELFFRDIKTTMDMDVLRCRDPEMVRKEILMHFIVYNAIRRMMGRAAQKIGVLPRQISFKASIQALRQWEPRLSQPGLTAQEMRERMASLLEAIADKTLTCRPGRQEPRCVKRRPKPFSLLTRPRHEMKEVAHRGKKHVKQA